jgi:hypothetical protein
MSLEQTSILFPVLRCMYAMMRVRLMTSFHLHCQIELMRGFMDFLQAFLPNVTDAVSPSYKVETFCQPYCWRDDHLTH